ncbi:MAG: o-succinylbenzoate synthase [Dehalococcoidia bacterium]|nr:o-succinylbenzoate synthase [Dehalococcoidia bacterium]
MRHRFEAAHGAIADRRGVLIEIADGEGYVGVGEASPIPSLGYGTVEDVLVLLQRYGAALPATLDLLHALDPRAPGVLALRCAVDVAALDLEGRRAGRSVASLLSTAATNVASAVRVNAVIGEGAPEETARYGRGAAAQGYAVLKAKVGSAALAEDVRRIAALREACPGVAIRLDANGAWDEATAVAALRAFAPHGIELIEQPVAAGEVEALARVRAAAHALGAATGGGPLIAADEAVADQDTLARVFEQRAADLVVLKPMFLGGLRPAVAIAQRAAACGMGAFATTTFDSSIGTAAALHLACAMDGAGEIAHGLGTGEHLTADLVVHTLVARDGMLSLPSGAGLGVAPEEAAWHRVAEGDWITAPYAHPPWRP